jgi:Predicted dehydrogenases and related proteins
MQKLKVGVFGAARGRTMINMLLDNPDAELVAVCDKFRPLLDSCGEEAKNRGIKLDLYERFDDFIQHDMDAVVLANYANEHAPFAIRLLESGRHVMSEVLTVATLDEAVRLAEAVEKTGKVYSYAENYCYFNTTAEMRRRYKHGDVGELSHAEGEYIHDCASIWPQITYGERWHWRNRMYSTFYNTHSLGPIVYSTGLRPVKVTGFEGPNKPFMAKLGAVAGSHGIELVQLENGATVKSIHGYLKREPGSINYQMYCSKGCMETDRWDSGKLHVYIEGEHNCEGEHTAYNPEFAVVGERAQGMGHGGSDFFTTYYFIRKILGDPDGIANSIDVYTALDMCVPGILAYRSILNGGATQDVPDFRDKIAREKYRGDTFCTFREIAGDMYAPPSPGGEVELPDEVYEAVRQKWLRGERG